MLFNSFHFVFFFLIVTSLYYLLPNKYRWLLLLISSCFFYGFFVPIYLLILGFTIVVDYFAGILIEKSVGKKRKQFLILSLVANIGILATFKYYNFFNDILTSFLHVFDIQNHVPYLSILLPIGLSFHTFQAMSYTIEVYRGNQKAEKHFGLYALYVMFFPQLVAGPIERPQNLIHQFYEKHPFRYENISIGLKLMLWGLLKKVVIADRLSVYVNAVYNNAEHHSGVTFMVATVFFAFQIYCDFSGYSDIAIGTAKVLGYDLMKNFNRPYLSKSVAEFWNRWHISLSTWFKDYVYIPLGGNRVAIKRIYLNLLIVFIISGFWHGANWTYIAWGASNGVLLILTMSLKKMEIPFLKNKKLSLIFTPISIGITFILICLTWIFFRANSIHDALMIYQKIGSLEGSLYIPKIRNEIFSLLYSIVAILALITIEVKQEFFKEKFQEIQNRYMIKQISYAMILIIIVLFGVFDGGQFIYFQF